MQNQRNYSKGKKKTKNYVGGSYAPVPSTFIPAADITHRDGDIFASSVVTPSPFKPTIVPALTVFDTTSDTFVAKSDNRYFANEQYRGMLQPSSTISGGTSNNTYSTYGGAPSVNTIASGSYGAGIATVNSGAGASLPPSTPAPVVSQPVVTTTASSGSYGVPSTASSYVSSGSYGVPSTASSYVSSGSYGVPPTVQPTTQPIAPAPQLTIVTAGTGGLPTPTSTVSGYGIGGGTMSGYGGGGGSTPAPTPVKTAQPFNWWWIIAGAGITGYLLLGKD
jgi:hypothetical protein